MQETNKQKTKAKMEQYWVYYRTSKEDLWWKANVVSFPTQDIAQSALEAWRLSNTDWEWMLADTDEPTEEERAKFSQKVDKYLKNAIRNCAEEYPEEEGETL